LIDLNTNQGHTESTKEHQKSDGKGSMAKESQILSICLPTPQIDQMVIGIL